MQDLIKLDSVCVNCFLQSWKWCLSMATQIWQIKAFSAIHGLNHQKHPVVDAYTSKGIERTMSGLNI